MKESERGKKKLEGTPGAMPITQEKEEKEVDLNETAKKQGLMTDEEFQSILDGVSRMEADTDEMTEGLDLASQEVGEGKHSGTAKESGIPAHQSAEVVEEKELGKENTEEEGQNSETPQSEAKEGDEKNKEAQQEETESMVPEVLKPKAVKSKLVLKRDTKVEGKKPTRVSQRCLGKWTSSRAGSNTVEEAVDVSSDEERATPTKPGEKTLTISHRGTTLATETVPPTPTDQRKEGDEMAEGQDLASQSVGQEEAIDDATSSAW